MIELTIKKGKLDWLKTYIKEIEKQNIEGILETVLQFKEKKDYRILIFVLFI